MWLYSSKPSNAVGLIAGSIMILPLDCGTKPG